MFNKSVLPLVLLFLVTASLTLVFSKTLMQHGIDWQVLIGGNLFIYIVTMVSMQLLRQGLNAATTYAFLTRAYGGIMLKLFACAAAAFVYIFVNGSKLNKPALFTCMGLYMVYTFMELVLHGLAEMNVINKSFVEATLTFNDSLADMLNEDDDDDDEDSGFN